MHYHHNTPYKVDKIKENEGRSLPVVWGYMDWVLNGFIAGSPIEKGLEESIGWEIFSLYIFTQIGNNYLFQNFTPLVHFYSHFTIYTAIKIAPHISSHLSIFERALIFRTLVVQIEKVVHVYVINCWQE